MVPKLELKGWFVKIKICPPQVLANDDSVVKDSPNLKNNNTLTIFLSILFLQFDMNMPLSEKYKILTISIGVW